MGECVCVWGGGGVIGWWVGECVCVGGERGDRSVGG